MSIFKAYDIRGIYPHELNEEKAFLIGEVCARRFKSGVFVTGYDARLSSKKLQSSFLKGLKNAALKGHKNFEIRKAGLITTPMFTFLVNVLKAQGGAMITASHSPVEYNGFKIVGPKASSISGKEIGELIELTQLF